jgi:SEC-C motif-containing protein
MRSRYSAYALALPEYLLATWHPDSRPNKLDLSEEPTITWICLAIKLATPEQENKATVEFVARYNAAGKAYRLHELSEFIKLDRRWYYLSGNQPDED